MSFMIDDSDSDRYYLIPVSDIEILLAFNEVWDLSDATKQERWIHKTIRRLSKNKKTVSLTSSFKIASLD